MRLTELTTTLVIGMILPSSWSWTGRYNRQAFGVSLSMSDASETQNPCWQDIYDDDCSMTDVYAANFVASKWIQSMPCGEGIEDCDMPENLTTPGIRPEGGVDQVDVMDFLGLKKAESVDEPKTDETP